MANKKRATKTAGPKKRAAKKRNLPAKIKQLTINRAALEREIKKGAKLSAKARALAKDAAGLDKLATDTKKMGEAFKNMAGCSDTLKAENSEACKPVYEKPTPEDTAKMVVQLLNRHQTNEQNQAVAIVLNELQLDRDRRLQYLQSESDNLSKHLIEAEKVKRGFEAIREGGLERLAFRKNIF